MRVLALLSVIVGLLLAATRGPQAQPPLSGRPAAGTRAIPTPTRLNSDGDSTPDDVAKWYREHGYRFLVLSDHNVLTNPDGLNAVSARASSSC